MSSLAPPKGLPCPAPPQPAESPELDPQSLSQINEQHLPLFGSQTAGQGWAAWKGGGAIWNIMYFWPILSPELGSQPPLPVRNVLDLHMGGLTLADWAWGGGGGTHSPLSSPDATWKATDDPLYCLNYSIVPWSKQKRNSVSIGCVKELNTPSGPVPLPQTVPRPRVLGIDRAGGGWEGRRYRPGLNFSHVQKLWPTVPCPSHRCEALTMC